MRRAAGQFVNLGIAGLVLVGAILCWEMSVCTPVRLGMPGSGSPSCEGSAFALVSNPSEIWREVASGEIDLARLRQYTYITAINSALALGLAAAFSLVWYWFGARFEVVRRAGYGFVWFFQVVPYVAFAWIFSIAFGDYDKPIFGFLVAVFPMLGSLLNCLRNIAMSDKEVMVMLAAPHRARMLHLYLPKASSYFFSGATLAAPLSVVGVMIADLSGGENAGLGREIFIAVRNAQPADLWIYTLAAIGVSLVLCAFVWSMEAMFGMTHRWYLKEAVNVEA